MSKDITDFIRDFIIDFLGSFVPGTFLLIGIYVGIIWPLQMYLTCDVATPALRRAILILSSQSGTAPGLFAQALIAYLIGLSYSKKSVRWADSASFYYNQCVAPNQQTSPASLSDISLRRQPGFRPWLLAYLRFKICYATRFAFGVPPKHLTVVELPYNDLHNYLEERGLSFAAMNVNWRHDQTKEGQLRSGMDLEYFNAIKMRIQLAFPNEYYSIMYFEAQNRLLSSVFYVAAQAWFLVAIFSLVSLVYLIVACPGWWALFPWSLSLLVTFIFCFFKHRMLDILHKERIREVVRVFESAAVLGVFEATGSWHPADFFLKRERSTTPKIE